MAVGCPYRKDSPQHAADILEETSQQRPSARIRLKWRIEWIAQSVAEELIALLPGTWAFRFGEALGRLLWRLMPQRRRIVIKNLRLVLAGEKSMEQIERLAQASFVRSLANLISAVHTARLPRAVLESRVVVENPEVLEAVVQGGGGGLLLPPHMGNWEILSRIKRLYPEGHAQGALYRPLNNPYLDARLADRRQSEGTRMFSKRDSLLAITSFLREGGIIGVLADQRAGYQGTLTNFFGRLTRVSPLPQLLMRRCKVPGMAVSIRTTAPGRWAMKYHPVAEPRDVAACMDAIERAMRESLIDVFWFQDRWKCYVSQDYTLHDWLGSPDVRSTRRRHRVLVWLVDAPMEWELPDAWKHPDVDCEWVLADQQAVPEWMADGTTVHRLGEASGIAAISRRIAEIEMLQPLPLDFIMGPMQSKELRKASRQQGLVYVPIKNP